MRGAPVTLTVISAIAISCAPQAASAQGPAHYQGERDLRDEKARGILDDYAACLLERRRRAIVKALALPSGSMAQDKALQVAVIDRCIWESSITAPFDLLRGSLYKALAREELKSASVSLPDLRIDYKELAGPVSSEWQARSEARLLNFANCALYKAPDAVRTIVMADANSEQERTGFAQLQPHLGECLYQGETMSFAPRKLLSLLAEVYYRSVSASQTASVQ